MVEGAGSGGSVGQVSGGRAGKNDAEAYLHSGFDDAPIGIALVGTEPGAEGRFLRVNRALCELAGLSRRQLTQTDVRAIIHPDDAEPDLAATTRLLAGAQLGFSLEQRLLNRGRRSVWVLVNAWLVRDEAGTPLYCIRQIQDIEERKRFKGELGFLADHDPLTGLLNRRGFVLELTGQMAHARRYGGGGSVLILDLDNFNSVNDTLGHDVGDQVIADCARIVSERLRETDAFARLGGDEFAVLLPQANAAMPRACRRVCSRPSEGDPGTRSRATPPR